VAAPVHAAAPNSTAHRRPIRPAANLNGVTKRFQQAIQLMRRHDPQAKEDGFHLLLPHMLIGVQHARRAWRGPQKQRPEDWARFLSRLSIHPVLQLTHTSWNTIARVSAAPT